MSYRFKGDFVKLEGRRNVLVPSSLPDNPFAGTVCIDKDDNYYFKYYDGTKWITLDISTGRTGQTLECGYGATANSGKWLEFHDNIPSNTSPVVFPDSRIVRAFSVHCERTCTVTFAIYKNDSQIDTLVVTNSKKGWKSALTHEFDAGDTIAVKVLSGSCKEPLFNIF